MINSIYRGKTCDKYCNAVSNDGFHIWVEGNLLGPGIDNYWCIITCFQGENTEIYKEFGDMFDEHFEVIPETICKYIGLKDINNTNAFTGDIIKDTTGNIWVIFCHKSGFYISMAIDYLKEWNSITNMPFNYLNLAENYNIIWFENNTKIIGNIFDNSELLNVKSCAKANRKIITCGECKWSAECDYGGLLCIEDPEMPIVVCDSDTCFAAANKDEF